jgi:hypothetical protein
MLVTMKNSDLIDQLVLIAGGDMDLVTQAIRASAGSPDGEADLKAVVDYIVRHRKPEPLAA